KQQGVFPYDQYQSKTHYRVTFKGPDADADSSLAKFSNTQKAGDQPTIFAPAPFEVLSPAVGKDAQVTIPAGQDLTVSWVPGESVDATAHTPERAFPFVKIVGLMNGATHRVWNCPLNDGKVHSTFTVPKEIIAQMDPQGIIQVGQLTHVLAKVSKQTADGTVED